MKTILPLLRIAGALALATLVPFTSTTSAAPKPPPRHVELTVTGPIFSLPDVFITIRRNDARTGDVCDCPFDYTDAEAAACLAP